MSSLLTTTSGDDSGGTTVSIDHHNNIVKLLNGTQANLVKLIHNDANAFLVAPAASGYVAARNWLQIQDTAGVETLAIYYSGQIRSAVATGTAPFVVASTTKVSNLNADLVDGLDTSGTAGGTLVSTTGTETLTGKTLTTPTIASLVNANHTHADAAGGGQLGTTGLSDDAVTTAKIAALAVTNAKIGPLAVGTTEIAALAVTAAKISVTDTFPWWIDVNVFMTAAANTGWDSINSGGNVYGYWKNSSGAQNDLISWDLVLAAGTWAVELLHNNGPDRGVYSVQFDAVEKGTIDGYSAGTAEVRASVTGIAVAATKKITVMLKMATKNAASSSYIGAIKAVRLIRTA